MTVNKFWMVYRMGLAPNSPPRMEHSLLSEAMLEAERLAKRHLGATFVVLEAIRACSIAKPVTWVDCTRP